MSGASVKLHQYSCSREVLALASALGLKPDALGDMLRKSARITHPKGNRRYHDFVFMVEGGVVKGITKVNEGDEVVTLPTTEPSLMAVEKELATAQRQLSEARHQLHSANYKLKYCVAQVQKLKGKPEPVKITDGLPEDEKIVNCEACNDSGRVQVFDDCLSCDGVGCSKCDDGLIKSSIPCPMCVNRRQGKLVVRHSTMV